MLRITTYILPVVLFVAIGRINAQAIDSIWNTYDIQDIVVTAQYVPTHYKNANHSIRVIRGEEIEQLGFLNLSEVLATQINSQQTIDPILGNGQKIQGIGGENIQILIDGVPVIGRLGGNIDLNQINLPDVDRIEIVEGAMSTQYGSNAAGGVINIITKKTQIKTLSFQASSQYESIGTRNHQASIGWRWKKLYLQGSYNFIDSQPEDVDSLRLFETIELSNGERVTQRVYPWNPKTQENWNFGVSYRFSDSIKIRYSYRSFDETLVRYGNIRRPQFRPYTLDEYYETDRRDHSVHLKVYLSPKLYLESTAGFNRYQREKKNPSTRIRTRYFFSFSNRAGYDFILRIFAANKFEFFAFQKMERSTWFSDLL